MESGKKNRRNVWKKKTRKENFTISTIPEETGEWQKNYHLCLDSSLIGVENCVDIIERLAKGL